MPKGSRGSSWGLSVYLLLPTPVQYSWNFWVSLDTVILTGRHFDEKNKKTKIKAECHLCKIAQLHHLNPSLCPLWGKSWTGWDLGPGGTSSQTPLSPHPQPRPLVAEEGPGEAVGHAGRTREVGFQLPQDLRHLGSGFSASLGRISSLTTLPETCRDDLSHPALSTRRRCQPWADLQRGSGSQ